MSSSLSVRFDDQVLERLRRRARMEPGLTASGVAQRLVDEELRMVEHPGIVSRTVRAAGGPHWRSAPTSGKS